MEKVVRAEFQAEQLVELFVASRHHDDDAVVLRACVATNLEAVLARQVDVEQHQVGVTRDDRGDGVGAVEQAVHLVLMRAQIVCDQCGQWDVVFDEQDSDGHR